MIGLFDSGYGGLTILHGIIDLLPQYSYVYLGDNARAPYGSRSAEEVFNFTVEGMGYLFDQGCQLVILACNTASTGALRRIQQEILPSRYPDKKVLGIVVPTIEQVTGIPWKNNKPSVSAPLGQLTVGILATQRTVDSKVYEAEIHKRNPSIRVVQQACPELVEAVERGASRAEIVPIIKSSIQNLYGQVPADAAPISAIVLGCTHFALIADDIRRELPDGVRLYEQPAIVAKSLKQYLESHPDIEKALSLGKPVEFITTGNPAVVSAISDRYFKSNVNFKKYQPGL